MIGGKLPITRLKSRSRSNFKLDRKISIRSRNFDRDHDRDRGDCDQTQPWFQPEKWPVPSSEGSTTIFVSVRTAAARQSSQHAKEVNLFRHSTRHNSISPSKPAAMLIRHRLDDMSTRTSRRNRGHHRSREPHFSCWIALISSSEELKVKQRAQTTRSPRPVTASTRKLSSQSASVHFVSGRRLQVYCLVTLVSFHHMAQLLPSFLPKERYCHRFTLPRLSRVWSCLQRLHRSVSPAKSLRLIVIATSLWRP